LSFETDNIYAPPGWERSPKDTIFLDREFVHPRIDWIRDEGLLGPGLSRTLQHVHRNRPVGAQFWIGQVTGHAQGFENPEFSREPAYRHLGDVDVGYRILAAFRLWNIIEYWFPYRELIEENWDDVLHELLPVFVEASDLNAYRQALMRLIAHVHDTHANIGSALDSRPPVGPCGLPFDFRFIAGQALVTRLRKAAKDDVLRVGDVILALDHRSIDDLVEEWSPFYGASNEPARLRDIAMSLSRGNCGPLTAAVDRDGQRLDMKLERVADWMEGSQEWYDHPGDSFALLGDEVAFLNLSSITVESIRGHVETALGKRGLILDIRNYPSGEVQELGRYVVGKPTPYARITEPDFDNPGTFTWESQEAELSPREPRYHGEVVILVNEDTQSFAELVSMAFRATGALVIGSTTAGADGNAAWFDLPGGEWALISSLGVFYPDGRPTQRLGIVPDIVVTPTREGIRAGRDEVLERALREILGPEVSELEIRQLAARPTAERPAHDNIE
jgi:C-terminal processing protease CtpA/Prc